MTTDITGCRRRCEIMNRPSYIVLFKGDDSDFQGNQSVNIVIDTELDTTGMKAHFRFMDFVQDFDSIPENKTLNLVFPNAKTSEFPLGAADATLRFEDASGKFRTVSNRIHIVVTNSVHEAYENEDSQSITVTVKGTVTWEMIEGKPTFAPVATSGSYNDLSDKPEIPAPVTIDPSLSPTSENPVQNKVVTEALYTGFTEWTTSPPESSVRWLEIEEVVVGWVISYGQAETAATGGTDPNATSISANVDGTFCIATRHLVTPTKTSQLSNDGPSSGPNVGLPFATTNQIPAPVDISGKLDGAAAYPAWELDRDYAEGDVVFHDGKLWKAIEENRDSEPSDESASWYRDGITIGLLKQDALSQSQLAAVNSGATAAKVAAWDGYAAQIAAKANASDLPYAMVTPGEWEFSDGVDRTLTISEVAENTWVYYYTISGNDVYAQEQFATRSEAESALSLTFEDSDLTATRASLPGHLCDRAGNRVVVTGDTTLTLPAAVPGYIRDFLVRLEISGSTVPTITFAAPTGETITYETDGDEFPVPDEAGTWSYSFTENCVAHKFAVSLKKINAVTQGGS